VTTFIFILALLLWLVLGILGVMFKTFIWLAIIAFGLFIVTGIVIIARTFNRK
jgi:hypothetical protein